VSLTSLEVHIGTAVFVVQAEATASASSVWVEGVCFHVGIVARYGLAVNLREAEETGSVPLGLSFSSRHLSTGEVVPQRRRLALAMVAC
jgi:hypothetical protein